MGSARRVLAVAVLVGSVIAVASPVNAVLLSDLVSSQDPQLRQIEIGDKLFTNFSVTVTGLPTYVADPAGIDVTGVDQGGVYGLHFAPANSGTSIFSADAGAYVDVLIGFDVTATKPGFTISGLNLSFTGQAPGDGLAQIVETATGGSDSPVLLQVSTLGSATATVSFVNSHSSIHVDKDIAVVAGTESGAQIDDFTQLFYQVPEPETALLVVLGGLAVFGRQLGRRRTVLAAVIGLGLAGLLVQPNTASAGVLLSTLDDNPSGSYAYGDFTFSNFDFEIVAGTGKWIADTATIEVQGFTTPYGSEDGLRFAGLIAALSNVTPSSSLTITLDYDVTIQPGTAGIDDVTMSFNGAPTASDGRAQVGKTVLDSQGAGVGSLLVWNQPSNLTEPLRLQDHAVLSGGPYTTVHIHDRIIVDGGASGATTISFINQTFSQVPEPASLALLGLGIPALLYRRKR
jgi:hypothetical protein